jgi:hypothetical protein
MSLGVQSATRHHLRAAVACALLSLAAVAARAQDPEPAPPPDPSAAFFDDTQLHDVRLRIHSSDWQELRENFDSNRYYPCDFVWQGQTIRNVGIRSRGSGSRNPNKPGLRVDFNRYAASQEFLGLHAFVLDNLYTDPAMIRERVAMELLDRMRVPAPREAYARLWVNEDYIGLYALVEEIDKRFLRRVEGLDDDGYLFEYRWNDTWHFTYLGSDLDPYERRFAARTRETESSTALYDPIEQFVRTVNDPHDVERDVGEFLSIRTFLRQLAVEAFLAEWDGLAGDFGINNFYLYRKPNGKEFTFIPWDKDNTFKSADYPVWPDGMNPNELTRRLLDESALRTYFFDALLECVRIVELREGEPGEDGQPPLPWLEREIRAHYAQIADAARADGRKMHSNDRFEGAVTALLEFARTRPGFVRDFVNRRR